MRDLSPCGKSNSCLTKLLGGLSYKQIRRYNKSPPYVMARWPSQQMPPLNFLGLKSVTCIRQLKYLLSQKKKKINSLIYSSLSHHRPSLQLILNIENRIHQHSGSINTDRFRHPRIQVDQMIHRLPTLWQSFILRASYGC